MAGIITVEHGRKRYGDVVAIEDVSFSVEAGEIFGLLGRNGAGKTTTVECLQGLRSADGGRLEVLGLDPGRHHDRLRRRIGSQLQSAALPDRLRVGEAVRLFATLHDEPVDLAATLEAWGLSHLRRRPFARLSGGQQQRLFLALALLGRPEVVFLDELTTGLDPQARRATWELVRGVRDRGATVVVVTHFMEEADALCDRVAIMDEGRIVALDTPRGLVAQRGGEVRSTFTPDGHDPRFLAALAGVSSVRVERGLATVTSDAAATVRVAAALVEHGITPVDFRTHHPTLDDAFLALTGPVEANGGGAR
ncbi:MAG: ATP-binding cassette domain-containing protein [Acidimicrobiia bacterium]|nr:ATP-binding cassette domain-containing protein [Acidimicrobiia bacterium]